MEDIRVPKVKLLEILRKNRETHRQVFLLALKGYREAAVKRFDELLELAKAGRKFDHIIQFVQPVDQTDDYDRAIEMLEMSVDDIITLTEQDFRCYVQDKWAWKKQWSVSNKLYTPDAMWTGEDAHL